MDLTGGGAVCTCTIITTEANELFSEVHNRMPVIVPRDNEDFWPDPKNEDYDVLLASAEVLLVRQDGILPCAAKGPICWRAIHRRGPSRYGRP
jgi:hypothetical protein